MPIPSLLPLGYLGDDRVKGYPTRRIIDGLSYWFKGPFFRIEPAHFFGVDCTGCFKLVCESCQLKNNLLMTMDVDITAYDSLGKMFLGKDVFDEDII